MNEFTSPAVQAMNIIRYIGEHITKSGNPIDHLSAADLQTTIGATSERLTTQVIDELRERGIVTVSDAGWYHGKKVYSEINLSLDGWERYEAEKRGQFDGNYGFLAMQFGDVDLDNFVSDIVKPTVKEATGCDLVDMRDVSKAGIIDNIMRVRIRDAKFVIVDLTHDNNGAYWEAGYAEGLGKPVIYICQKEKFDAEETHFDTNHCTTVPWSREADEGFRQELTATLRRSLDQSA